MSEVMLDKAKTLEPLNPNKSTGIFGGKSSGILNWNDIAYPHWYKMYKRLVGNYWQADEVNMSGDVKQFASLTKAEQDAYLKVIGLLSTLDGPQARTALLLSLYATDPSVQSIMAVIAQQEAVHNESYSYVLSSVVSLDEQNESFQLGRKDPVLLKRNAYIMEQYNAFVENPSVKNILKTLVYTALLEGMFFYRLWLSSPSKKQCIMKAILTCCPPSFHWTSRMNPFNLEEKIRFCSNVMHILWNSIMPL